MSDGYVELPITTDPDDLYRQAVEDLQAGIPGWEPSEGQLDVWMLLVTARVAATVRDLAADVPSSIFRYIGKNLFNVPANESLPATVSVTVTTNISTGTTVPAGSVFGITVGDETLGFRLEYDLVFSSGQTSKSAVLLRCTEDGIVGNGVGGSGVAMVNVSSIANVSSVTMEGASSGGSEAETDEEYQNRLSNRLTLMAPRPILPSDFAEMARDVAGIYRAVAVDMYNPVTATYGNERTLTVYAMDETGAAPSSPVLTSLLDYLQSFRETTFQVFTRAPTFVPVDVTYSVKMWPGYVNTAVVSACNAALADALSPLRTGVPPTGDPRTWVDVSTLRLNDVVAILASVEGVMDVLTVTMKKTSSGTYSTADIALGGPGAVLQMGTATGSAS